MMNTSLQNIITHQTSSLHDSEIKILFQARQYPKFQLDDFYKKGELMRKKQFIYFVELLEKWNQQVIRRNDTLDQCSYIKHEFIFSWLKGLAVRNEGQIDAQLQQLFSWANPTKISSPPLLRKQTSNQSRFEQWEIRNCYKSTLPLEIDTYKRRFIIQPQKEDLPQSAQLSRTVEHSLSFSKQNSNSIAIRKQNNFLKSSREQAEVRSCLNNFRKNKVYFYNSVTKNYYKGKFQRDKLATASSFFKTSNSLFYSDEIKGYRIKTNTGSRPFGSTPNSLNKTSFPTFASSYLIDNDKKISAGPSESPAFKLNLSNIDGVGLMGNPFEVKIRKKNK